ncbi:MAG: nucleotidyltransferase family protein [Mogibacterium sp.]|nr:nucleotidyltransferase family protein [Mogibacterium sp.]
MNNYRTVENIYFNLARNTILTTSSEKLSDTPSGEEGLSCRLKESASKCNNLEELIEGSKTKAYTYTRINRIITQAILHIDREEANQGALYVRVLGFSKKGREIIKEIKKSDNETLPVLTNINKEAATLDELTYKQLEKDILAGDMYSVLVNRPLYEHSDKVRMPILLEK